MAKPDNHRELTPNPHFKQRKLSGTGLIVEVELSANALSTALEKAFDQADRQLNYIQSVAPGLVGAGHSTDAKQKLEELFGLRKTELESDIGQMQAYIESRKMSLIQHPARTTRIGLHSQLSGDLLELFKLADKATSLVDALWISHAVDDEARTNKSKDLRNKCHLCISAVDAIYSKLRELANQKQVA